MNKQKNEKHDDFLKTVIIVLGGFLLLFTIVNLIIFLITGSEPAVLIGCVFAACLGEGSLCGLIKTSKNKVKKQLDAEVREDDMDEYY